MKVYGKTLKDERFFPTDSPSWRKVVTRTYRKRARRQGKEALAA